MVAAIVRGGYAVAGCNNMALEADIMDDVILACKVISGLSFGGAIAALAWGHRHERKVGGGRRKSTEKEVELKSMVGRNKDDVATTDVLVVNTGDRNLGDEAVLSASDAEPATRVGRVRRILLEFIIFMCFFNLVVLVAIIFIASCAFNAFAKKASTYQMLHDELDTKWAMENHAAPIIVGEFGTSCDGVDRVWWDYMMKFLGEKDLSWAYWPWNAAQWHLYDSSFGEDYFSIINMDAKTTRCEPLLAGLQGIQHS